MELQDYLNRIGYEGPITTDLAVLKGVHRAHACSLTYENLDVILERPVTQDIEQIYQKIVTRGRGGWCYEMNGLLGWALNEIGFDVTRMCGGVMRAAAGDDAFGNHLVLLVTLEDQQWIADVGLGDGILEPIPLSEGEHSHAGRTFRLEKLDEKVWRFHNRQNGLPPSFDFIDDDTTEHKLEATCQTLQSDPESMFRQNLICQKMNTNGGWVLLGRVLRSFDSEAPRTLLNTEAELSNTLLDKFRVEAPDTGALWEKVQVRHLEMFGDTPVEDIQFGPPPTEDGNST